MRDPIHLLSLGIDKRRGEEEPTHVLRVSWTENDLPSRAGFGEAVALAYGSIELPWFPAGAWVMVAQATRTTTIEASEPEDQATVEAGLWAAVVTAASGYG